MTNMGNTVSPISKRDAKFEKETLRSKCYLPGKHVNVQRQSL
jgi:hypothetical protein